MANDRGRNEGNNNPLPRRLARNQPDPVPTKEDRGQIFCDNRTGLQSGASLRNRYEDGSHLPNQTDRD